MGGYAAFEVMRRAPERVAKLALIATLASADGPAQTARRQGYIDLVTSGQFDQVVEERIPILFPEDKRSDARLLGIAARDEPELRRRSSRSSARSWRGSTAARGWAKSRCRRC